MDEYDAIMLVETVLYAKRMEQDGKIQTDEGDDLERFALTMKEIAEKAQKAFNSETDEEYGGWDEAYATMEKELKERYTPKKTYYVHLKEYLSAYRTIPVEAKSRDEVYEMVIPKLKAGEYEALFNDIWVDELDHDDLELLGINEEE